MVSKKKGAHITAKLVPGIQLWKWSKLDATVVEEWESEGNDSNVHLSVLCFTHWMPRTS